MNCLWVEEAKDLSNYGIKWDWFKFKIKMSSIAFLKKTSWECLKLEEELNFKYQDALNRLQQNPSNVTKRAFENLKVNLKHCMIRKLRG